MANLTGTMLSGYGVYDQADRLNALGNDVLSNTQTLADQAVSGTQFKPYTVTSNLGHASVDDSGGIAYGLNPEQLAQQNQLSRGASSLFGQALQPQAGREQDIYKRIRATQMPEENRAGLSMDNRLTGQGRSGIRSAAYGGTPEQLAYNKAIQESQNNASLMAIQQAQAEQRQQAELGGMFQQGSYLPSATLANLFSPSVNTSNIQQNAQIQGQNFASQLGLGGIQSQVNAEMLRSQLMSQLYGDLGQSANNSNFDPLGDAWDWAKGKIGL